MKQRGVTYLALLFVVAAMTAALASVATYYSFEQQRQKELQLLWIGKQFTRAIGSYYQRSPGNVKQYPPNLEDLVEDRRFLTTERHLRRVYEDPFTGKADWVLVRQGDGIVGVHSASSRAPIKTGGFGATGRVVDGTQYRGWFFVYLPPN